MKRYNYHVANMINYCRERNIIPMELTHEERKQFILSEDLKYGYFALMKKKKCQVCGKETGRLAHGYNVYLCGQKCYDVLCAATADNHPELYKMRREKEKVWHVIHIKQLLDLTYSPEEIAERVECSLEDILCIIEEIKNGGHSEE